MEFRRLERMRRQFESELPENVVLEVPIKTEIYDQSKFIVAILFLVSTIIFSLTMEVTYILFQATIYLGLAYYLSFTISYFHQLFYPRKVYFTDDLLYFYRETIYAIPIIEITKMKFDYNKVKVMYDKEATHFLLNKTSFRKTIKQIKSLLKEKLPIQS